MSQLEDVLKENALLKQKIVELESKLQKLENCTETIPSFCTDYSSVLPIVDSELTNEEISRYGRQLILKDIGPKGKLNFTYIILIKTL